MSQLSQFVVVGLCAVVLAATAGVGSLRTKTEATRGEKVAAQPASNETHAKEHVPAQGHDHQNSQETKPTKPIAPSLSVQAALARRARTEEIRQKMQTVVQVEYIDTPLHDVANFLSSKIGVPILLDRNAMAEESISADEPIVFVARETTVEQTLNWILEEFAMTWLIDQDVLLLTTELEAESVLETRVYDASHLIDFADESVARLGLPGSVHDWNQQISGVGLGEQEFSAGSGFFQISPTSSSQRVANQMAGTLATQFGGGGLGTGEQFMDDERDSSATMLRDAIISSVEPEYWEDAGGEGQMISFGNSLFVVRAGPKVQEKVGQLLRTMEAIIDGESITGSLAVRRRFYPHEADRQIQEQLGKETHVQFIETPLRDVLEFLADQGNISIRIKKNELAAEGIDQSEPINLVLNNVPLSSVLEQTLEPIGCTTVVDDGVLWVTSAVDADERMSIAVYEVEDLIENEQIGTLVELVQIENSGTWEWAGGTGSISEFGATMLIIRQTPQIQRQVEVLLHSLRQNTRNSPRQPKLKKNATKTVSAITKLYPITDKETAADLLHAIPAMIAPGSWEKENEIAKAGQVIVIRGKQAVHHDVAAFLTQLQTAHSMLPQPVAAEKEDEKK